MRAFRYPLAAALRLASQREQARRAELAAVEAQARQVAEHLAELRQRWRLLEARVRQLAARAEPDARDMTTGGRLAAYSAEIARLRELLTRADAHWRTLEQRRQRAQAALAEATKARKQLERHRQLRAERHLREESAEELKHLDEVAGLHYHRVRSSLPSRALGSVARRQR